MSNPFSQIKDLLAARGYRATLPRVGVLRVFCQNPLPLRVEEVHQRLGRAGVNLASVYRSVNLFHQLRVLRRLKFDEKFYRYELTDRYRDHHHHLICSTCGRVEDVFQCDLSAHERRIKKERGFHVATHHLEFYGLCQECRNSR